MSYMLTSKYRSRNVYARSSSVHLVCFLVIWHFHFKVDRCKKRNEFRVREVMCYDWGHAVYFFPNYISFLPPSVTSSIVCCLFFFQQSSSEDEVSHSGYKEDPSGSSQSGLWPPRLKLSCVYYFQSLFLLFHFFFMAYLGFFFLVGPQEDF